MELARSGEGQNTASLKWLALSPEGPGAVPLGKLLRALTILRSLIVSGEGTREEGTEGKSTGGCLASISAYTSVEVGARPLEVRACIAFWY